MIRGESCHAPIVLPPSFCPHRFAPINRPPHHSAPYHSANSSPCRTDHFDIQINNSGSFNTVCTSFGAGRKKLPIAKSNIPSSLKSPLTTDR